MNNTAYSNASSAPNPYPLPYSPQQPQLTAGSNEGGALEASGGAQSLAQAALGSGLDGGRQNTAQQQHEHAPTSNGAGNKRKRGDGASSRGVANLTPAQLEKKRANDREAQRAIRERTRAHIEGLEARIRDLESSQPFQQLQQALLHRDDVLRQNEELKRRLAAISAMVGGPGGPAGGVGVPPGALQELAALTSQQSPMPMPQQQHNAALSPPQPHSIYPGYEPQQQQQHHLHPSLRSPQHTPGLQQATLRQYSPSLEHPGAPYSGSPTQGPDGAAYAPAQPQAPQAHMQAVAGAERHNLQYLLGQHHSPSQTQASVRSPTLSTNEQPVWARLTKLTQPTCPLDNILIDFLIERQQLAQAGTPALELTGPEQPDVTVIKHPERANGAHAVSRVFADIISKFPDISGLAERVAVFYVMHNLTRWSINPTMEAYSRLPEWIRPTSAQLNIAHPAWVDHLPWPHMRSLLSEQLNFVRFDDFFVPFTRTLSLNWPYPADDVLLRSDGYHGDDAGLLTGKEEYMVNPVFIAHLRDLSNWSLGSEFRRAFPALVSSTMRISD